MIPNQQPKFYISASELEIRQLKHKLERTKWENELNENLLDSLLDQQKQAKKILCDPYDTPLKKLTFLKKVYDI